MTTKASLAITSDEAGTISALRTGDLFAARNEWYEYAQKAVELVPRHNVSTCDFGGI